MWSTGDIEVALLRGVETRDLEVKGPCGPRDIGPMGRVVRGVLAMSNIAYGGRLIIGIDDGAIGAMSPGLTADQTRDWTTGSKAHDLIAKYADPPIDVVLTEHGLANGNRLVLLDVPGIAGEAHFCMKDLHDPKGNKQILRTGALYTRGRGKPESVEVSTRDQMAEIIESAATYRLRAFVEQADRAGISLSFPGRQPAPRPDGRADGDYFAQQHREAFT